MRIVGGKYKGRKLAAPRSSDIRPTSDRAREALFNILFHAHDGAPRDMRVLDLFAGTGAVGLEALSRGASFALFVENSTEGRGLLRTNIEGVGAQGHCKVFRRDATSLGPCGTMEPFDFVFADPPYGRGLGEKALIAAAEGEWLRPGALAILEEASGTPITLPPELAILETRSIGAASMHFFQFQP